ncbi:hypothetical protein K8352_13475 [Flavobacteriaceae bacterium F89]|uniref:Uncharacterized protein n=1 Tax=Cerina litoralis TaxID=2874477 RepID=A0AAE3EWV7_9FLAO|nr:hypothetical protein [Cerina litoralis]MCG2461763.1 hypothetical protein [Cerina litoralis]
MKDNQTMSERTQKMKKLYWHVQHWKSDLQFMEDETNFVEQLLNSDIFKPNMPNQFERMQDYLGRLDEFKERKTRLGKVILKHENRLGSLLERYDDDALKTSIFLRQDDLEMEVLSCTDDFKNLKAEIFNYVGGTLKKRIADTS